MGDPGNPTDPSGTPPDPDPGQPGWASPAPPPPPPPSPPADPTPDPTPVAGEPPAAAAPAYGTPPPPVPPTPAGDAGWTPPPAPVKKRKLTWLWILIPVLLVFAVSVILIAVFAIRAIVGPLEATDDYFALLRDERYADAYDARCASFQAQISQGDFVQREQANGPVRDFDIDGFDTDGDDATTDGDVTRAGIEYDVTVRLEKEDGDWKVCEIEARR